MKVWKLLGVGLMVLLLVACGGGLGTTEPPVSTIPSAEMPEDIYLSPFSLAERYRWEVVPADETTPRHLAVWLEEGILSAETPILRIFAADPNASPPTLDGLAALPLAAQAKELTGDRVSGVRAVVLSDSAEMPIESTDLVYQFNGLSQDGRFRVEASVPSVATALVASDDPVEVARFLNGLAPVDWSPSLVVLDRLIGSLRFDDDPPPDSAEGPLSGTDWQWIMLENSDDTVYPVPNPARYTLSFAADGSLSGQADCNDIVGSWSREGDTLSLTLLTTLADCGERSMADPFVSGLNQVTGFEISADGDLLLRLADGRALRFQPAVP